MDNADAEIVSRCGSWAFEAGPVSVDPAKMLRIHGYRDLAKVRPAIRQAAEDIALKAERIMAPKAQACRIDVVAYEENKLTLSNGTVFNDVDFEHVLDGARSVVAVVLTVGRGLDEAVIAAMDEFEPLDALFLETAGWLGIEAATRKFVQDLQLRVKTESVRVTRRLGPGYQYKIGGQPVNWPLEQQRLLFDVFEGVDLPVTLMESCAMLPKMSRSGLYGLTLVN
ncbi:MAG: hypothetical protein CBB68_02225 [Rhodospirillaceae bacterium TMED8]|nr:MAG: hypothetical protein CBB68_02225 [Rhodospirillaceae bacterium TMED8]